MNCPNCQKELLPDSRFCPFCGAPTALRCTSCGAQLEPNQAFCTECGTKVPPSTTTSTTSSSQTVSPESSPPSQYGASPVHSTVSSSGGSPSSSASSITITYDPAKVQPAQQRPYDSYYSGGSPVQTSPSGLVPVGVGRRLAAIIIDGILLYVMFYFTAKAFGTATTTYQGGFETSFSMSGPSALISMFLGFAYFWVLEGTLGATLGKLLFGCRVVKADGSKCTLGASAIRNLLRIVDAVPYLIPYLLGAILVWTSPTKQRFGDRIAKTLVVRR